MEKNKLEYVSKDEYLEKLKEKSWEYYYKMKGCYYDKRIREDYKNLSKWFCNEYRLVKELFMISGISDGVNYMKIDGVYYVIKE